MNFIRISPGDFIPFFSGLGLRPNSLLCPKSGGEKETHFHPAQFQCPENKKGITAVHAHPGSWSGYAFDLQTNGTGRQGSSDFYHSFFKGLIVFSRILLYAFIIFGSSPNQLIEYFMEICQGPGRKVPAPSGRPQASAG
jgi:hypothetical protein